MRSKNGVSESRNTEQNGTKFIPSPKQVKFLEAYLDPDVYPSVTKICEQCGVSRTTYYEWIKDEDFCKWFLGQMDKHRTHVVAHLEKIGVTMAKKDHRYWADMMRRMGRLEGQVESGMKKAGEQVSNALYELISINRDEG